MSYSASPGGPTRGTLFRMASSGTGNNFHTYELTQTPSNGHYQVAMDGRWQSFNNGPRANLMMFYIGIWDCRAFCGTHVNGNTYMEIQSVYMQQCFP
jgi:hypothetical protein